MAFLFVLHLLGCCAKSVDMERRKAMSHDPLFDHRYTHSALAFIYDEVWVRLDTQGKITTWENIEEPGNDWRIEE